MRLSRPRRCGFHPMILLCGNSSKNQNAFTLIELLVVVAIIGLLASVILFALNSARDKAKVASATANISQFGKAMELYYDSNNTCSCAMHCYDGVCDPLTVSTNCLANSISPYIATFPPTDPWDLKWRYHCHPGGGSSGESTCFFSSGPNGVVEAWPWSSSSFVGDDIGWCQGQPGNLGY